MAPHGFPMGRNGPAYGEADMKQVEFTVGARVRVARHLGGIGPGASYNMAPGPVGTVVSVDHLANKTGGEPFAQVKLDLPSDDWEVRESHGNRVAVWYEGSLQDSQPSDWELV